MSKAADAFRTISEVAAELSVPKHVLRFWEAKFPQIRPMKRGGGRRYYRPGDMELLRGIRHLLHAEGYTIKGVQKILREQGIDAVKHAVRAEPVPGPAEGRGRRTVKPGDTVPPPLQSDAGSTPESGAPSGRQLMQRMIAELEACRGLLQTDGAQPRSGRRARQARG